MKQSGIYRIDLGNGWFYIGSAQNLRKRETQHRSSLKQKDHCNQKMQNVWNKYGIFKFKILEQCTEHELLNREQFYLDQCFDNKKNTNLAPKAGSNLGVVRSAETRAKLSIALTGKNRSAETRAKMSAAALNMSAETRAKMSAAQKLRDPVSAETRAKISASKKGTIVSAQTRAKISATSKGKVMSPETRAKMSAVKKKQSAETRAKIGAASKGRIHSIETREKMSEIKKAYYARKRAAKTLSI